MKIGDLLGPDCLVFDLQSTSREAVIKELAEAIAGRQSVLDANVLTKLLLDRENASSTAVGSGVAFPHVRNDAVKQLTLVVARSVPGVDFRAIDHKLTHLFFLLVAPREGDYLRALAMLSKEAPRLLDAAMAAADAEALAKIFSHSK